jgi:hypothetical protein
MKNDQGRERPDPAQQASEQPGVEALDRIGELLARAGEAGTSIARRHLDDWKAVSAHLRDPEGYSADGWARDSARVMASAIDDVQDVWRVWTPTETRPVAGGLPNVFLFFEVDENKGQGEDTLPAVQWIDAPRSIASPPRQASVALSGGPSKEAADILREAIKVDLDADKRKYHVKGTAPEPDVRIEPGTYVGLIYVRLEQSEEPLADLRVVVQSRGAG